jgi:alpha-beta hydrolase superfamily lysophospholipase
VGQSLPTPGRHQADTRQNVTLSSLLVHPTADRKIWIWLAKEIVDAAGADDVRYVEMPGAMHYLERDRPEAMQHVAGRLCACLSRRLQR